jgi:uncharacterized protein (DUF302 family)
MKRVLLAASLFAASAAYAGSPAVYEKSVNQPLDATYANVSKALEANGFRVVFEVNIGENLSKIADKLGANYNKNKLEGIKSLVFCNGKFANQISNLDPSMLATCPLHATFTHKDGVTTVLFVRPGVVAQGSPAAKAAQDLEAATIKALDAGINAK